MKQKWLVGAATMALLAAGPVTAAAASTKSASAAHRTDVTGCLAQGPEAKEYLIHTADGTTWGVQENDRDLRLNNYVGHEVTVVGEPEHASKAERKAEGASHILYARDVMVAGETCAK